MCKIKRLSLITIFLMVSFIASAQTIDTLFKQLDEFYYKNDFKNALLTGEKLKIKVAYIYSNKSKEYAVIISRLGSICSENGDYKEAESYNLEACEIFLKKLGAEHPYYLTSLNNLGVLYFRKGEYKKAEPILLELQIITKKTLGTENSDYTTILNNLGQLYTEIGEYKKAELILLEAQLIIKKTLGIENPDYALLLNNIGYLYSEMGLYKNGESYYLEALAIRKKILGNEHPDYATSLNNLGLNYSEIGDYKKAEAYYIEAKNTIEKVLGTKHPDYALSLNNLGSLYSDMGDYKKAEVYYLEALTIRKKILGTEHPGYALSLNNLGLLYSDMGEYKKAELSQLEALNIRKKALGIGHPDYALSLNNLGSLYSNMGEYKKAETYYLEALAIRKKVLGIGHPDYATSLNNLGVHYSQMGKFDKAITYFQEALTIQKKILGIEHPGYATSLNNLGSFYSDKGDYKKAETYYLEALAIRKKVLGIEHPDYATTLSNIGNFYYKIGNLKKAEAYFLEALTIREKVLGTLHPLYAMVLNNLGALYINMGSIIKAESFYLDAMDIRKEVLGVEHPDYSQTLNNLGVFYGLTKNYKKAELFFLESLAIREKVFGKEHELYSLSLNNLGWLYYTNSDYQKAESFFIQSVNIYKKVLGIDHPDYSTYLYNLGLLYYKIKNIPKSFEFIYQALGITNKSIKQNFDFLSELEKPMFIKTISCQFDVYNSLYFTSLSQNLSETYLLFNNELQNKGLILHSSLQIRNAIYKSRDSTLINSWNQLLEYKYQLSKIYSLPKDKYPNNIQSLEANAEKLEKKLLNQSQVYRHQHEQMQTDWKTVQQKLKLNEAAIEFISFPYFSTNGWIDSVLYAVLILKPGYSQPKFIYLFEEEQLSPILKKEDGTLDQSYINTLYKQKEGENLLYNLIWQPLDSILQGVTTVYAAPSGMLHNVALGAITTNDGRTIEGKYDLQIVATTADIINKKEDFIDNKSIQQAIVFGGINYDIASSKPFDFTSNADNNMYAYVPSDSTRGSTGKWNYLGGTFNEAEGIATKFKEQKITTHFYSDSTATETLFKNIPVTSSSIIHIATHGYFFPDIKRKKEDGMQLMSQEKQTAFKVSENPLLRSGLIFAGANPAWTNPDYVSTSTDDGILTAYEISNMDLSNVKLVVLSACETGLGDIKGSEGVFGLQRAFKLAGVKNIIMSLWKVPDEKTRELMQSFYQFCFTGKSVSDAFKSAQEKMRSKYPASPYYWAGFTLLQ